MRSEFRLFCGTTVIPLWNDVLRAKFETIVSFPKHVPNGYINTKRDNKKTHLLKGNKNEKRGIIKN